MKKLYWIISLLLFSPFAHAQWREVPLPDEVYYISISVWVNDSTIIGHNGVNNFCISEDGGNSYSYQPTNFPFSGIGPLTHPSKEIGYVVSWGNQLKKTTDTWKTYSLLLISNGTDTGFKGVPILFCQFWDTLNGVVMGDSVNGCLEIWTTQDGGISWDRLPCNPEINININHFISPFAKPCFEKFGDGGYLGFPEESRMFFKISDYGHTWVQNKVPASQFFTGYFAFKNPSEGMIIRDLNQDVERTNIAVTRDGGTTWDTSYMMNADMRKVEYAAATANYPEIYMLVGSGSYMIRSFTESPIEIDLEGHYEVSFFNAERGVTYFTKKARVFDPNVIRTSVVQTKTTRFDFYPNPAGKQLNVKASNEGTLQIIDVMGIVRARFQVEAGTNQLPLELVPGNYYVLIDGMYSKILTVVD